MGPAIETRGLAKVYRSRRQTVRAVEALDLRIERGEIYGLLGPNGAGKTTTIRMICGLLRPSEGRAWVDGLAVNGSGRQVRRRIGLVPEDAGHHNNLTLSEELRYYGAYYGLGREAVLARAAPLAERLAIADRMDRRLRTFSRGMRRKAHLIRALVHEPSVLLLDEPTAGLDPAVTVEVWDLLRSLASDRGVTIIFCSHHLEEVQRLCDRVGIIKRKLLAQGAPAELARQDSGVDVAVEGDPSGFASAVAALPGVRETEADGERLRVWMSEQTSRVTPEVVRALVESGARVRSVRPVETDLRSVFRSVVGQDEQEASASEQEER